MTVPIAEPRKKLMTVATPTRPIVHGTASAITADTGASPFESETPRSPRKSSTQYSKYCSQIGLGFSRPNRTRSESIASGLTLPWLRAR